MLESVAETFNKIRAALQVKEEQAVDEINFAYALERRKVIKILDQKTQERIILRDYILALEKLAMDELFFQAFTKNIGFFSISSEVQEVNQFLEDLKTEFNSALTGFENVLIPKINKFEATLVDKEYIRAMGDLTLPNDSQPFTSSR